jgi:hypothetical protein
MTDKPSYEPSVLFVCAHNAGRSHDRSQRAFAPVMIMAWPSTFAPGIETSHESSGYAGCVMASSSAASSLDRTGTTGTPSSSNMVAARRQAERARSGSWAAA